MFGKRPTGGIGDQGAPQMSAPQPALAQEVAVAELEKVEAAPPMKVEQARPAARAEAVEHNEEYYDCLLYTSPSPRDLSTSRMPSSA